jgi:hypothetical protein
MDFTIKKYKELLTALIKQGFIFQTFEEFIKDPQKRSVILRHDVDRLPWNALVMAKIENSKNIKASYYFRVAKEAYNEDAIRQIIALGHEAGYHYEDLDLSSGNIDLAYKSYLKNLEHFRQFYPVSTICMHGSPLSKYDNRDVWKKYNYKKDGIIGEPYFDIDYSQLFYITDTGRQWNNASISVRDKVLSNFNIKVHDTSHLIDLIEQKLLPDQIMINTHPHRWFDDIIPWSKEFVLQNIKNVVKGVLIASKKYNEG